MLSKKIGSAERGRIIRMYFTQSLAQNVAVVSVRWHSVDTLLVCDQVALPLELAAANVAVKVSIYTHKDIQMLLFT